MKAKVLDLLTNGLMMTDAEDFLGSIASLRFNIPFAA
jgi:hypothetical protein